MIGLKFLMKPKKDCKPIQYTHLKSRTFEKSCTSTISNVLKRIGTPLTIPYLNLSFIIATVNLHGAFAVNKISNTQKNLEKKIQKYKKEYSDLYVMRQPECKIHLTMLTILNKESINFFCTLYQ